MARRTKHHGLRRHARTPQTPRRSLTDHQSARYEKAVTESTPDHTARPASSALPGALDVVGISALARYRAERRARLSGTASGGNLLIQTFHLDQQHMANATTERSAAPEDSPAAGAPSAQPDPPEQRARLPTSAATPSTTQTDQSPAVPHRPYLRCPPPAH
jgi:hypothetical protein